LVKALTTITNSLKSGDISCVHAEEYCHKVKNLIENLHLFDLDFDFIGVFIYIQISILPQRELLLSRLGALEDFKVSFCYIFESNYVLHSSCCDKEEEKDHK
jgi:hypothetical protein